MNRNLILGPCILDHAHFKTRPRPLTLLVPGFHPFLPEHPEVVFNTHFKCRNNINTLYRHTHAHTHTHLRSLLPQSTPAAESHTHYKARWVSAEVSSVRGGNLSAGHSGCSSSRWTQTKRVGTHGSSPALFYAGVKCRVSTSRPKSSL